MRACVLQFDILLHVLSVLARPFIEIKMAISDKNMMAEIESTDVIIDVVTITKTRFAQIHENLGKT